MTEELGTEAAAPAVASIPKTPAKRPSGYGLNIIALVCIAIATCCVLLGLVLPATSHPYGTDGLPAEPTAKWPLVWFGCGLLNVGVFLWAVGRILRALFFLPGRELDDEDFWS